MIKISKGLNCKHVSQMSRKLCHNHIISLRKNAELKCTHPLIHSSLLLMDFVSETPSMSFLWALWWTRRHRHILVSAGPSNYSNDKTILWLHQCELFPGSPLLSPYYLAQTFPWFSSMSAHPLQQASHERPIYLHHYTKEEEKTNTWLGVIVLE